MRGTGIVTKLSNLDVSRIALCKSPADQDAVFVVVKSEDDAPVATEESTAAAPVEEAPAAPVADETATPVADETATPEATQDETIATPAEEPEVAKEEIESVITVPSVSVGNVSMAGMVFKTSRRLSESQLKAVTADIHKQYEDFQKTGRPIVLQDGFDVVYAPVEKSPVISESRTEEFSAAPADDGMKDCIKGLVDKCNESRAVPKSVLKMIGDVAKYHGVEGPDMEGEDAFVEVTAQLRAVVDILKGLAVVMAKPAPAAAPPEPAAAPAAKPKPTPAKKSIDTVRKEALEEVRFQLLKALGKDPCPPGE